MDEFGAIAYGEVLQSSFTICKLPPLIATPPSAPGAAHFPSNIRIRSLPGFAESIVWDFSSPDP